MVKSWSIEAPGEHLLCRVKIFLSDGSELIYNEPLVLWDVCVAAEIAPIIGLSGLSPDP